MTEDLLEIRRLRERGDVIIWDLGSSKLSKNKREILKREYWVNYEKLKELDKDKKFNNIHYDELLPPWPERKNPWNKREQKIINNWNKDRKKK